MYQPSPSSGQMPELTRPEPPDSVLTAVKLMYAGAVVNGLALIVGLATIGNLRSALHRADPSLTPTQLHNFEVFYVTLSVVTGLIGVGLWILMAVMNRRGHGWARILATVLFGIYTLFLVLGFSRAGAAVGTLFSLLTWLIGLATIVLLWRRQSSEYFNAPGPR